MTLDECKTVKDCFLWAEQEWPGFWEFANQLPITEGEAEELETYINEDEDKFKKFMEKVIELGKNKDATDESRTLLVKGAGAFLRLQRRINGN